MFSMRRFQRLAKSAYGIVGGVIAIGAAAAAAGAAPAALTPWSSNEAPATTAAAPVTTIATGGASEPLVDGHPLTVVTTATPEPTTPVTPPATTPVATTPVATTPVATTPVAKEAAPEPTPSPVEVPASTPPPAPPTTATHAEPAATSPATSPGPSAPPNPPAPATTAATLVSDNVVPAGLSLSCNAATSASGTDVNCEWSGTIPAGFAKFLLLRGNQTATGRVPFQSGDPSAHHFTDVALAPGTYTYVVVAVDGAGTPLVHSNMVAITSPAG